MKHNKITKIPLTHSVPQPKTRRKYPKIYLHQRGTNRTGGRRWWSSAIVGGWRRWSSVVVGRRRRTWAELAGREREREREREEMHTVWWSDLGG
jgi:hypothetical protein